ncbi:NUDIX hydrolase [Candidatus Saccharibacteria bacterium]|nr:NUDIX hydrolase [Candidatus Saccharibacteria bacterium]
MKNVNLRVAAKAVIMNDRNQILILRESETHVGGSQAGKYGLVGGRIGSDEPFFDGLRREVREETGLEIEIEKPIFVGEWWPEIHGARNHIVATFMLCRAKSTAVKLSEEHDDFQWINRDEMSEFTFMPPDDEVILRAFEL